MTVTSVAKTEDDTGGHAHIDGSYLTWQGRGNDIHKITIHSHSVKVRVRHRPTAAAEEGGPKEEETSGESVGPTAEQQVGFLVKMYFTPQCLRLGGKVRFISGNLIYLAPRDSGLGCKIHFTGFPFSYITRTGHGM